MFWWLWINLNTCHWRTCASFVGPNSMKTDMLWRYFLTTERMVILDSGNLAWRTWQVSETYKCSGLVGKKRACWTCASMSSVIFIVQITGTMRGWQFYTVWKARRYLISFLFRITVELFPVLLKCYVWNSCQERICNKKNCWKKLHTFFLVLRTQIWLLLCCFRCYLFSGKLALASSASALAALSALLLLSQRWGKERWVRGDTGSLVYLI